MPFQLGKFQMDSNKSQAYGGSAPLPLVFVFTSGTFLQKIISAKENQKATVK